MAVQGIFASDSNIQGSKKGDLAGSLLQTEQTGDSPLFALTAGMQSADASDVIISWFEENPLTGRTTITNNAAVGATIVVADASELVAGVIALIESSGEYIFIQSIAVNTLTVTRGFGGTTITAVDGSVTPVGLQRITNANEEGSGKPTSIANLGVPKFNYMQTFRNSWDVTGTARAVEYVTGDIVAKNRSDAAILHAADIERALIYGMMAVGTISGRAFRTMKGVARHLSTNLTTQGANTTWTELDAFLQGVFSRNIKGKPNERICFVGDTALRTINNVAKLNGTTELMPVVKMFGMDVRDWTTPFGSVKLIRNPMFSQSPLWTKDLLVLHPAAMRVRYLRRTFEDTYDKDGSRAGADADFGVFTTEMTCEYKAEATGGLFTGMDTAATG